MELRKYMMYIDDGEDCYKIAVPAENEEQAIKLVSGSAKEVIAIKDVSENVIIDCNRVADGLRKAYFNKFEIDFITRSLLHTGIGF